MQDIVLKLVKIAIPVFWAARNAFIDYKAPHYWHIALETITNHTTKCKYVATRPEE